MEKDEGRGVYGRAEGVRFEAAHESFLCGAARPLFPILQAGRADTVPEMAHGPALAARKDLACRSVTP